MTLTPQRKPNHSLFLGIQRMESSDNPQPPPLPNIMPANHSHSHLITTTTSSSMMMHHQQQQPGFPFVPPSLPEPLDPLATATGLYHPSCFSMEPAKKKRGRPRKYAPEGNIALGLGPTSTPPSSGSGAAPVSLSTEPLAKKNRGRPPGSGKKQMDALGVGGIGFTPHVIMVKAGEDIASKIVAFSQEGPRAVCILSAHGAVCSVTLKQPSLPGPATTYEGRYEIISLAGSFQFLDGDINNSRLGSLSVSLAGPDGRVVGGGVAGILTAATPVQVIVGSFLAGKKRTSWNTLKSGSPSAPQPQTLNFGDPQMMVSPPSKGGGSSDSSGENGNGGSPVTRPGSGYYNDVSQPMHNYMYQHIWASQGHR